VHELSICAAVIDQLEQLARQHGACRVRRVELSVGPLSGVEAHLLEQAFEVARAGTVAESAQLCSTTAAVRIRCPSCDAEHEVRPNRLRCARCGEWRTQVIAGDELLLRRVEFEINEETTHV